MLSFEEVMKTAKPNQPTCDPCSRPPRIFEAQANGVVLVVDEQNYARYMRVRPDGHLGALED